MHVAQLKKPVSSIGSIRSLVSFRILELVPVEKTTPESSSLGSLSNTKEKAT